MASDIYIHFYYKSYTLELVNLYQSLAIVLSTMMTRLSFGNFDFAFLVNYKANKNYNKNYNYAANKKL